MTDDYEHVTADYEHVTADYDLIHERLRTTRIKLGLDVKEVADDIGLVPQYFGQLEINRTPNQWNNILQLAGRYKTTTDYLLGAPLAGNPERNPNSAHTSEAMKAMQIMDSYPPAVRAVLLESLEKLAEVMSKLVDQATENLQLRLTLSEYSTRLTEDEIRVSDATVAERLAQLLSRDDS